MDAPAVAAYAAPGLLRAPALPGQPIGRAGPPVGASYPQGWQPIVPTPAAGGRVSRGLRLVGTGFTMAKDEPGLMMVPVVAFLLQLLIFAAGGLILLPTLRSMNANQGQPVHFSAGQWLVMVVVGIVVMFVSVVSHATIIARVMARFHGQSVTNTQAARAALTKTPQLMAWAFIDYVVISILRSIGNRGILGAIPWRSLLPGRGRCWPASSWFR